MGVKIKKTFKRQVHCNMQIIGGIEFSESLVDIMDFLNTHKLNQFHIAHRSL